MLCNWDVLLLATITILVCVTAVDNGDSSIIIINGYPHSVAIKGNLIVEVGTNEQVLKKKGANTVILDAKNGSVLPGFWDTHFHLMFGSLAFADVADLSLAETVEQGVQTLQQYARSHPGNETVLGILSPYFNYTREILDTVDNGRPVFVFSYDIHTVYVSTSVLEKGGVLYPPPELRDNIPVDQNGTATGQLNESPGYRTVINQTGVAGAMLMHRIIDMSTDDKGLIPISQYKDEIKKLLYIALEDMPKHGITGISLADGDKDALNLYEELEDEGKLTVRINMGFTIRPTDVKEDKLDKIIIKDKPCSGEKMVCSDIAKFFIDGVVETHTAAVLEPYPDTNITGHLYWNESDFLTALKKVDDQGNYRVSTHCIGDAAVRFALNGFEAAMQRDGAPKRDRRWSIEHIELLDASDTERFKRSNITASMQPLHAGFTPDGYYYAQIWDKLKKRLFVWKEFEDSGVNLTWGSDWPVVGYDVIEAITYAYKTRPLFDESKGVKDQRVSYETAVAGYTSSAAWLHHAENYRGKVEKNYLADLVVVSDRKIDDSTTKVLFTICNGKITYNSMGQDSSSSSPPIPSSGIASTSSGAQVIGCHIMFICMSLLLINH